MAREYVFKCDRCGRASMQPSEALPQGWCIVITADGGNEACSCGCAVRLLLQSGTVNGGRLGGALPAQLGTGATAALPSVANSDQTIRLTVPTIEVKQ
jgi:hypothetical protein